MKKAICVTVAIVWISCGIYAWHGWYAAFVGEFPESHRTELEKISECRAGFLWGMAGGPIALAATWPDGAIYPPQSCNLWVKEPAR